MVRETNPSLSRRAFVATAAAAGALAAAGGAQSHQGFDDLLGVQQAFASEGEEKIVWSQCNVNCGGRCVLRHHVKDGKIVYTETDNLGDAENEHQARACLRGRSYRHWINSPDRLLYPMKRVGKRGSGDFVQITWDEALDTIAAKIKDVIANYGNEAIFIHKGTGKYTAIGTDDTKTGMLPQRFFNTIGGYLEYRGSYSIGAMQGYSPFMFGAAYNPLDGVGASSVSEAQNADLMVLFGYSAADTRMGGANGVWDMVKVRESGTEIIQIDPRMNEQCSGFGDEWVPIRTGTDGALVSAIAHELIVNEKVDLDFLRTYCVGYDEETMPESAKGQNKSYKDYIMGTGYDMVEKTPEWAAPITTIPAEKIRDLAKRIGEAKKLFVSQGWSVQRHSAGETNCLSICMLPLLTGQIGLEGTNTGISMAAQVAKPLVASIPQGVNPVKTSIPVYQWLNAIDHGKDMTSTNAGVQGRDRLQTGIKLLWCFAGNGITNQHGEINKVHDILQDESKCEFIVCHDIMMTDSCKYADIILPDTMVAETLSLSTNGYSEYYQGVCLGQPAQEAPGEARPAYDVYADLAERFGKRAEFTEGLDNDGWIERLYNEGAALDPEMPTFDEIKEQGLFRRELPSQIGLKDFRSDPVGNPLTTPSGKIEIFSETLDEMSRTWEIAEGDAITPIPSFEPGFEGYGSVTDEYPLYCAQFHYKARTHSCYANVPEIAAVARHQVWVNPQDAEARGIEEGDICAVRSPYGEIRIEAHVTYRVIPGCIFIPQGAWHDADMFGDRIDHGGCYNTLLGYHPTPVTKQQNSNSVIAQISKA